MTRWYLNIFSLILVITTCLAMAAGNSSSDTPDDAAMLMKLGRFFSSEQKQDKAIYYFKRAEAVYRKGHDQYRIALACNYLAWAYREINKPDSAIIYAESAFSHFRKDHDFSEIFYNRQLLGHIYGDLGLIDKSLAVQLEGLTYCERGNDTIALVTAYTNIAAIFGDRYQRQKGIEYDLKALSILNTVKTGDIGIICYLLNNLGVQYLEDKQYDHALHYFHWSLAEKRKRNDVQGLVFTLNNFGDLYLRINKPDSALPFLREGMSLALSSNDKLGQCISYSTMGTYYRDVRDYRKAVEMFTRAIELSRIVNYREQELSLLKDLGDSYEHLKAYTGALAFFRQYSDLKDTLFQERSRKDLSDMLTRYHTAEKEKQVILLNAENDRISARNQRNMLIIAGLLIVCVVLLLASVAIYYFNRQKLIAYKSLVKKDLEVIAAEREMKKDPDAEGKMLLPVPELSQADDIQPELFDELVLLMNSKKRYLDPDVTLSIIAKEMNSNTTYLSRVINSFSGKNFNHFVNEFRVKEARLMLADPENSRYSIEGIARSVGFNSRSVFNTAFKKITGVTPSFYQESARQMFAADGHSSSLVPKGVDGIQSGSLTGGVPAEENTYHR